MAVQLKGSEAQPALPPQQPTPPKAKFFRGRKSFAGVNETYWSPAELKIVTEFVDANPTNKNWQECAKKVNQYRQENQISGKRSDVNCRIFYLTTQHCLFKTVSDEHLKLIKAKFEEFSKGEKKPKFTKPKENALKTYATDLLKFSPTDRTWSAIKAYVQGGPKEGWTEAQLREVEACYTLPQEDRPDINDFWKINLKGAHTVSAIQTLASEIGIAKKIIKWTKEELQLVKAFCDDPNDTRTWDQFAQDTFTANGKLRRTGKACRAIAVEKGFLNSSRTWTESENTLLKNYCLDSTDKRSWEEFVETSLPKRTVMGAQAHARVEKYQKVDRIWWHPQLLQRLEEFSEEKPTLDKWTKFLKKDTFKPFTPEVCLEVVKEKGWIFDESEKVKKKTTTSHTGVRTDVWDEGEVEIVENFGANKTPHQTWQHCADRVNAYRKEKNLPGFRTDQGCTQRYRQTESYLITQIDSKKLNQLKEYAEKLSEQASISVKDRGLQLKAHAESLGMPTTDKMWKAIKKYLDLNPHMRWTTDKVTALKKYYAIPERERDSPKEACQRLFKGAITLKQFHRKAGMLGLTSKIVPWTKEEEAPLQAYCNDDNDLRTWAEFAKATYTVDGELTRTIAACRHHATKKEWLKNRHWIEAENMCLKDYCNDPNDPRPWDEFVEQALIKRTIHSAQLHAASLGYKKIDRIWWHPKLIAKLETLSKHELNHEQWTTLLQDKIFSRFPIDTYIDLAKTRNWIVAQTTPLSPSHLDAYLDALATSPENDIPDDESF